tara:strand:+ start:551 stop:904 length:354 start_codon:yes stop_codon:yes gene_type:complete
MSIRQYIEEIDAIRQEIASNNKRNTELKKRYKVLETNIKEYLQENDQYGMKYNKTAIILEQSKTRKSIGTKKEKNEIILNILKNSGIQNPNDILTEIEQVQKGKSVTKERLKFKKLD